MHLCHGKYTHVTSSPAVGVHSSHSPVPGGWGLSTVQAAADRRLARGLGRMYAANSAINCACSTRTRACEPGPSLFTLITPSSASFLAVVSLTPIAAAMTGHVSSCRECRMFNALHPHARRPSLPPHPFAPRAPNCSPPRRTVVVRAACTAWPYRVPRTRRSRMSRPPH